MPLCQFPIFCYFCVSEKLHRKYSRNWMKQKPNIQKFTEASKELKRRRSGATGQAHHRATRPAPGLRPLVVRPPWPTSDAAPSPIKTPRQDKPKEPDHFSRIHRDPPPPLTRDWEGPEALLGTLPERRITTGGLLYHHACLRHDE
jgi:hypothetical protein